MYRFFTTATIARVFFSPTFFSFHLHSLSIKMADANTSSRISTLRPRNAEGVVVAPLNPPAHLPAHPVQQARQHAMALPQFEVVHPHLAERVLVGPGVPHQGLPQNALAPAQIALRARSPLSPRTRERAGALSVKMRSPTRGPSSST